jgi:hypothetical protein
MMKAIRTAIAVLISFAVYAACYDNAFAVYYTIQLKNGNEVKSDKYWKEGDVVRFYTKEGVVGIPEKIIGQIVTTTGTVDLQSKEEVMEALSAETQPEQPEAARKADTKKDELIDDIKDRIVVIESNLESLTKNKNLYMSQNEQYLQQKQKAEERIQTLKNDPYVNPKDNKESIDFEESKLKDIQDKIKETEAKLQNADRMIEAQTRMKERLEGEMATANK